MIILKFSFKKVIIYLKIKMSIKPTCFLGNNLTSTFYNRSIHSNIKINCALSKLIHENLMCCVCIRQIEHILVWCPLKIFIYLFILGIIVVSCP